MHRSNVKALMGTAIDLGGNRKIMYRDHIYLLSGPRPIVCACNVYVYSFVCAYFMHANDTFMPSVYMSHFTFQSTLSKKRCLSPCFPTFSVIRATISYFSISISLSHR